MNFDKLSTETKALLGIIFLMLLPKLLEAAKGFAGSWLSSQAAWKKSVDTKLEEQKKTIEQLERDVKELSKQLGDLSGRHNTLDARVTTQGARYFEEVERVKSTLEAKQRQFEMKVDGRLESK